MLLTPQIEINAAWESMYNNNNEVSTSEIETGSEGLDLSFEKVQIAISCLPLHLLQEYFNLQDSAECPFSKGWYTYDV